MFKISRVGSGRVRIFSNITGRVGPVQPELTAGRVWRFISCRGTSRVGSGQEVANLSRVGSGRVRRFSNITDRVESGHPDPTTGRGRGYVNCRGTGRVGSGRVGSGQEVFEISRVESVRVKRFSNITDRVG